MLRKIALSLCLCLLTSCALLSQQGGTTSVTYRPASRDEFLSPLAQLEALPSKAESCTFSRLDKVTIDRKAGGELGIGLRYFDNSAPADIYYQLPNESVYHRTMHQHPEAPPETVRQMQYIEADLPGDWTAEEIHLVVVQGSTVLCPTRR